MLKKQLVALVMGLLPAISASASALDPGRDLASLLEYAKLHNPEYAALQSDAAAAQERMGQASALPDPVLRVELQSATKYTWMQALPFWGKRDLMRQATEAESQAKQAQALGAWKSVAARIKAAYSQYHALTQLLRINQEVIGLLDRIERTSQSRYAAGLAPQQDAIRAQVERSNLRGEGLQLETDRQLVRYRLNTLLARPAQAPLSEPETRRPLPPASRLEWARLESLLQLSSPQLAADEAMVRSAGKLRDWKQRSRFPDISVGVSNVQMENKGRQWELMFELSIPLQQGSRRSLEREAEHLLDAAKARQSATNHQLLGELAENLSGLEAAIQLEQLAHSSLLPQAELSFQSALAAYETGKVDFATLLDTQRQIRKTRQDIIRAQTEQQWRLAEMERLIGEDL